VERHVLPRIVVSVSYHYEHTTKRVGLQSGYHYNLFKYNLFVAETGRPDENHLPVVSHCQALSHDVVHLALTEIRTQNISGDMH
jgi:hypothetical protein